MKEFFEILDEIMKKIKAKKTWVIYEKTSISAMFREDYQSEILEILDKYNNKYIVSNYDEFNKMTYLYYFREELK